MSTKIKKDKKKVEESIIDNLLKIEGLSAEELSIYKNDLILNSEGKRTDNPI